MTGNNAIYKINRIVARSAASLLIEKFPEYKEECKKWHYLNLIKEELIKSIPF